MRLVPTLNITEGLCASKLIGLRAAKLRFPAKMLFKIRGLNSENHDQAALGIQFAIKNINVRDTTMNTRKTNCLYFFGRSK